MSLYIKWKDKVHGIVKYERWEKISSAKAKALIDSLGLPSVFNTSTWDRFYHIELIPFIESPNFIITKDKSSYDKREDYY